MNKEVLEKSFLEFLEGKYLELEGLSLHSFPDLFVEYFQTVRFIGFSEADDSDMMLFQYGKHNSNFSINFTRQIYQVFDEDCHQILQLSLTFYYELIEFSDVTSNTKWSMDYLDLNDFKNFIINSEGFIKAKDRKFNKIEFYVDLV